MVPRDWWPTFLRNVNWRTKSLLILVGSVLLFLGVIAATERWVILPRVEREELAALERQIDLIAARQAERHAVLEQQVADLARTDVVQRILDLPHQNTADLQWLTDKVHGGQLELLEIWDDSGRTVFGRGIERRTGNGHPLPPAIERSLSAQGLSAPPPARPETGIVLTPRGLLLFARQGIVAAENTKPMGVVLGGDFLRVNMLEHWLAGTDLRIRLYRAAEQPPALAQAKQVGANRYVAAESGDEIVGRLVFTDARGHYAGALELRSPRPFRQSQINNARLELLVIGSIVVIVATGLWLVIKFAFVRRLEQVTRLVSRLDATAVRTLEAFPGEDEVGRLARTTGKMAGHLSETRDLAISADRAKSAFLRLVTHELRTPMNGVIGFSALLRDTPLSEEQIDYANGIEHSSQLLMKLIDQLLDYTAMQALGVNLTPQPVRFRTWLRSVTCDFELQAVAKRLEFRQEVDAAVPDLIWIDPTRLQQVLGHLLGNALKFTTTGTVLVSVDMQPPWRSDELVMRFRVTDTGIGIAPELHAQLFEPFSPGDNSQARKFGGLGMGLVICRRLAHAMGGTVSFESKVGEGSRFSLVIPVRTSAPVVSSPIADGTATA